MSGKRFVVLHGHFYQPPRENPWIDEVEMQPSAWPHHDWNERVFAECYGPNGASRLLEGKGRIRDIVNNYAHFSFNFGPTLLSWIEEKHPDIYRQILDGDRQSLERLGHGNAVAQVYNHLIMPLATEKQKTLQIQWGIRDFEQRFGRKPEGMWLAETAIDMETIRCLIREGIRFTILSPTQAARVRPMHGDVWQDVANNEINPRQPYRLFALDEDGTPLEKGFLDVFFYDGPLSHGVGFEHLLTDANRYADRIASAFDPMDAKDQLVSVTTDGESYGHHEAFADMCAAYFFHDLCVQHDLIPVNYAWYLRHHSPEFEVRVKNAYSGGTAWSCAHGVGRWKEDCGCTNGEQPGWNQKWRAPLRAALDLLGGAVDPFLEREGPTVFTNWDLAQAQAVDAWSFQPGIRQGFWSRHLRSGAPRVGALRIVEILRFSHYMYTSCGWFFADITGIESAQVQKYALRVLQLLELSQEFSASDSGSKLRTSFLKVLSAAHSNLGNKPGDVFFRELEKESLPVEAYLALARWAQEFSGEPVPYAHSPLYPNPSASKRSFGTWNAWEFHFRHEFTEQALSAWLAFEKEGLEVEIYVIIPHPERRLADLENPSLRGPEDLLALAGSSGFKLLAKDLPIDIRERLATSLRKHYWKENSGYLAAIEMQLGHKQKQYSQLDWPFPSTLLQMMQVIENFHLVEELETGLQDGSLNNLQKAAHMAKRLRLAGWHVHLGNIKLVLHERMLDLGRELMRATKAIELDPLFALLDLVDTLGLTADRTQLENLTLPLYRNLGEFTRSGQFSGPISVEETIQVLDRLNFDTDAAKKRLHPPSPTEKAGLK